jgi:hypothetical protein
MDPQEYENLGLIEGDKLIADIKRQISKIDDELKKGKRTYMDGPNQRTITLNVFSEARAAVLEEKAGLEQQIKDISIALSKKAREYKPLAGFQTDLAKTETALANKYKTVVVPTEEKAPTGPSPIQTRAMTPTETTETVETTTTPTPTGTQPTAPAPGVPSQKDWVDSQLELRNLPDTPKNRKEIGAEYKKSKFKPLGDNWVEEFNKKFPTLGFLFTNPEFGPEVLAIAKKAVEQQWYLYPETAQALIAREIANTPYGQRSSAKQEAFDKKTQADQQVDIAQKVGELQKNYGKLGLSEADWQQIGRTAARNGLDDTLTQQKMLEFVYQKNPEGTLRYENAVKQLESGKLGQEVRKAYGNYFVTPDEDAIQKYATGQMTLEDINSQARTLAKQFYPALASMLDQGLTVKSVADQYAAIAASTLEMPANTIDMMDPKFRAAFDVRDGDKSRTMTSGEFQTLLKTDPKYGWQYTKTANQEAMDLATTIARAFGKVE